MISRPASFEFTAPRREHVLHPLALAAVGERDDKSAGRSKDVHWRSVDLTRLSTHVGENTESGKPAREEPADPVRENDIDLRQPSLAKAHHENA